MYFTTIENSSSVYFIQKLLSWIRIRLDPHLFSLLDPDPHSEKLLDRSGFSVFHISVHSYTFSQLVTPINYCIYSSIYITVYTVVNTTFLGISVLQICFFLRHILLFFHNLFEKTVYYTFSHFLNTHNIGNVNETF